MADPIPPGNGSACFFDERHAKGSTMALLGFAERCGEDAKGLLSTSERDRLVAALALAESAKLAAQAAAQLAADARYLAGYLMGAGVSLTPAGKA